ncbi:NAD(P)-dependent oxidoreductase [Kitasatospora sp. NPDC085879]|jgi:nucleoside-diphosphate-sugar epimerase|uniref:NAD-dependent epimerase/dehydratase family protein n=1 Tax=Kitasatospora sp. NPDC085879 TaxID=3154769 RepID=UPI003422B494
MRILLAGASGVLGRKAVRELTAAGHEVAGLGRGPANTLRADLLDREAVLRAVRGQSFDAVVHAATALQGRSMMRHRDMAGTDALRTGGTVNLLKAAREVGARRIVLETMMFGYGYGEHGDRPLEEGRDEYGPRVADPRERAHVDAMRAKEDLAFAADGLSAVSLRYGLFYGEGVSDTALLPLLRRRALPVAPDHGRKLSWVDVDDAARAIVLALEKGGDDRAYNIADDLPLGFGTHVRAVAEAFGAPRPMSVPRWLFRPAPLAACMLATNLRMSTARARRELGWEPSTDGPRRLAELAARTPVAV